MKNSLLCIVILISLIATIAYINVHYILCMFDATFIDSLPQISIICDSPIWHETMDIYIYIYNA